MDRYHCFVELAQNEHSGIDYRLRVRRAQPRFAIMAPHGGAIEPGTTEIADAIAGEEHSFHTLEGIKPRDNHVLHITSTKFDEPMCVTLLGQSSVVVTVHGEDSKPGGPPSEDGDEQGGDGVKAVFLGGLDHELGKRIKAALEPARFEVRKRDDIDGERPENICNRGTSGAGVQLELSRGLREMMFESLKGEGRTHPTPTFHRFVAAVRGVLDRA
jgi:phage replication-related protein YjqB (UPF0714/DUF867 family)